ncbi:hypothetical protein D3C86_2010970 [compost metagenome]
MRLHGALLAGVGLLHQLDDAFGLRHQQGVLLLLLAQVTVVLLEPFIERVDVADDFRQHRGIARTIHGIAQLTGQGLRIQGLLDFVLGDLGRSAALL